MPAYNPHFVAMLPVMKEGASGSPEYITIESKELLVAQGELIFAGDPLDVVYQVTSTHTINVAGLLKPEDL